LILLDIWAETFTIFTC